MARSQEWATRLLHEGQSHERSSFLTLTYNDEHIPRTNSLQPRDLQLFLKRLRIHLTRNSGDRIRFFACGEYGDRNYRPHYHVLLFGHDFPDKQPFGESPSGHPLYRSSELEKLWRLGFSDIGSVTKESAQYVARYIMKKVTGKRAGDHYKRVSPYTGELVTVLPEFLRMSTGGRGGEGGIGTRWYRSFKGDAVPSGFVVIDGERRPVPRFYKKKLQASAEVSAADRNDQLRMLQAGAEHARVNAEHNTPERLATREESQLLRLAQLKRDL